MASSSSPSGTRFCRPICTERSPLVRSPFWSNPAHSCFRPRCRCSLPLVLVRLQSVRCFDSPRPIERIHRLASVGVRSGCLCVTRAVNGPLYLCCGRVTASDHAVTPALVNGFVNRVDHVVRERRAHRMRRANVRPFGGGAPSVGQSLMTAIAVVFVHRAAYEPFAFVAVCAQVLMGRLSMGAKVSAMCAMASQSPSHI